MSVGPGARVRLLFFIRKPAIFIFLDVFFYLTTFITVDHTECRLVIHRPTAIQATKHSSGTTAGNHCVIPGNISFFMMLNTFDLYVTFFSLLFLLCGRCYFFVIIPATIMAMFIPQP